MDKKTNKILDRTKGKKIGLFIDNANWFYPQKELKWKISFTKLQKFLKKYYRIRILKIYAGTPLDNKDKKAFKNFCKAIEKAQFSIETKPIKKPQPCGWGVKN